MKSKIVLATLMFFCFAFAAELKVGAGAAATEGILKPIKEAFEKSTGIKLTTVSSGPKVALTDLDKGALDIAIAGLTVQDWADLMKKEGAEIKDMSVFSSLVIGKDSIKVLVNKKNKVKELTKDQLKGIFTGKITNWKEVGGVDSSIIVVWGKLISGTNSLFAKKIMDNEPLLASILEVNTADDVKQNVASSEEAIGIGPAAVVDATISSPKTPEVARPITLMTKGKASADAQKLIDFIAGEGKKYIK